MDISITSNRDNGSLVVTVAVRALSQGRFTSVFSAASAFPAFAIA
jgi:hypothetical protein